MVLTLNIEAKKAFEDFIRAKLLAMWVAQGHNMNGKVVREMDMLIEETSEALSFLFYFLPYGIYNETGVAASKIPFSGVGGGGKSAYIEALILYAQKRLRVRTLAEAKSAAFAIAYTHKKEGMSTRASVRFSQTGKRQGWITETFKENTSAIGEFLRKALSEILSTKFDILVSKYNAEFQK